MGTLRCQRNQSQVLVNVGEHCYCGESLSVKGSGFSEDQRFIKQDTSTLRL